MFKLITKALAKLRQYRLAFTILSLLIVFVLLVAPVFAYLYYAPITVTNTTGTAYTQLPLRWAQGNTYLAANGYMSASARDTRMETLSGSVLPHLVADDKTLTVTDVGANSSTNLKFTTGNTAQDMYVITGYGGSLTVADAPNLELANSFTIDTKRYINTDAGAGKYLYNGSTYSLYVSGATNISADVAAEDKVADSDNADADWVNHAGAHDGNWATSAPTVAGPPSGYLELYYSQPLTSDTVEFKGSDNAGAGGPVAEVGVYYSGGWNIISTAATTGGVQVLPIGSTQLVSGVRVRWTAVGAALRAWEMQVQQKAASVTVTGVTSGGRRVVNSYDGTNLTLSVYDSVGTHVGNSPQTLAWGLICPNNAGVYTVVTTNNATPYMEYLKVTTAIGGSSEKLYFQPNAIIATTVLPDRDGGDNNGTITWGTDFPTATVARGTLTNNTGVATGSPKNLVLGVNTIIVTVTGAGTFDTNITSITAPAYGSATAISGTATLTVSPHVLTAGADVIDTGVTTGTFTITVIGMAVTLGSMVSGATAGTAGITLETPTDVLPDVNVSNWYVDPDVTGSLLTNPLRPFVTMMSDNSALTEMQVWRFYGLIFVLFITVSVAKAFRGHLAITGIGMCVAIVTLVALTVWPIWALVFAIGALVGGLVAERSPSL